MRTKKMLMLKQNLHVSTAYVSMFYLILEQHDYELKNYKEI